MSLRNMFEFHPVTKIYKYFRDSVLYTCQVAFDCCVGTGQDSGHMKLVEETQNPMHEGCCRITQFSV
jgi:hypothetical protein